MNLCIPKQKIQLVGELFLNGSKSISNRLLLIQAIGNLSFTIDNLSESNDTKVLKRALSSDTNFIIDAENCGTAMRFLTSYLALNNYQGVLTGDERMCERPIQALVEALQSLGCHISYTNTYGFPPLEFKASEIKQNTLQVAAHVSSQFITSLLLSAPILNDGLTIQLDGDLISQPYVKMTLQLMSQFGITWQWDKKQIQVYAGNYTFEKQSYFVEGDWSSASYWYSLVAVSKDSSITLHGLEQQSMQGDSILPYIYSFLGVRTTFNEDKSITLTHSGYCAEYLLFDFSSNPDLAQTVAVTCTVLHVPCQLNGLQTLNNKESKRIQTLAQELSKCGAQCITTHESIQIIDFELSDTEVQIDTHDDHRIAMAFAPMCQRMPITLLNAEVVKKSYPSFFDDAKKIGLIF